MTDAAYTVILPEAPFPVDRIEYREPKKGDMIFYTGSQCWGAHEDDGKYHKFIAIPARPWYPDSWLDDAGNPLEGVREVVKGKWLPCDPDDIVCAIYHLDRAEKFLNTHRSKKPCPAENLDAKSIVAIRIIKASS